MINTKYDKKYNIDCHNRCQNTQGVVFGWITK